jgi:hypothetical protein
VDRTRTHVHAAPCSATFGRSIRFPAMYRSATAIILTAFLTACTTTRLTEPAETSTEQLLISTAIDDAVAKLKPSLPGDATAYLDTSNFDMAPADAVLFPKYTIGAVRDALLRDGARLVDDKKKADLIVERRTGGQSIDHNTFLVGIPSFPIPIPFTSNAYFPEIALYKRDRQTGVAKLAVTV